jgi:pimeloyl-ACP methyl ester carboxylesterase
VRIVLWGESLGSALAIALAAEKPVGRVVLEAPFTSAVDVGAQHYWFVPVRRFMKDQFRSDLRASKLTARLGVVPIQRLTSLAALLHPDVTEPVLDAYWRKNGDQPMIATIDLGKKVWRMARETGCLDQAAIDRLDEMRVALEQHRRVGSTPKNLQLIRQVLTEGVWREVVALPHVLMEQARSAKDHAPIKAAISARLAVAIAILTFAPVRLGNLVSIKLGENLIKPGGPDTPYGVVPLVISIR